ncbi:MAG: VapE domain-containing protein [Rhodoferax sp.]
MPDPQFPRVYEPIWDSIPQFLADKTQWLLWRYEAKEGQTKPLKVPYWTTGARRGGEQGGEKDRAKLVTLGEARRCYGKGNYTGIGFAFLPNDGLIGIDIDGAIDASTGEVSERLQAIITAVNSYTEYSPSGKGVHIIVQGETVTNKSNDIGLEIFCGRQYFTFTGKHWAGTPLTVEVIDAGVLKRLNATVDKAKSDRKQGAGNNPPSPPQATGVADLRARVESALQSISPDIGYNEWLAIGWALREAFGEFGFGLWSSWSAGSAKFQGDADMQSHWKSFTVSRAPDDAVGVIFARAIEAGWKPPKRKNTGQHSKNWQKNCESASQGVAGGDFPVSDEPWRDDLIYVKKSLRECIPNVVAIMGHHPSWVGVIGFDEFSQKVVKCKPAPFDAATPAGHINEWTDVDDTRTTIWLAKFEGFVPSSALVAEAVEVVARQNAFHPVLDYLRSLKHDGVSRVDNWMIDYLNVKDTEYTRRVSRWFLIGMCMRVLQPGIKFDYCLVLEGKQGRMKSSALRALGGEWFSDTELDLSHKDAMSAIRGHWLHEFGEMGSIARIESMRQKSFLSRQVDEFRPSYGRREIRCPRQLVFAGTTNEWQWNKDPTGGRRFWPVEIPDEVNLDALRQSRDQLLAEAFALALAGEKFWPNADEQSELFDPEQLSRETTEVFTELLALWLVSPGGANSEFSMSDAIISGLKIEAKSISRDIQTRVGHSLAKLGCERIERRSSAIRFLYKRPVKATTKTDENDCEQPVDNYY